MDKTATLTPIDADAVAEARASRPSDEKLAFVVGMFEALADPTRARILYALDKRSLTVRDLAIVVGVSESAVSHQLRLLRDRHLVRAQRQGNTMSYSLDDQHVVDLFRQAESHAEHHHIEHHSST